MATKRPGRPSKHDWDSKFDTCRRLYVEEGKSIKEIVDHFTANNDTDATIPTARDFTRQFNRWQFPARREKLAPDDEARLIARLKELWQANQTQPQMLDVLSSEGWQVDPYALARLRRKHGIVLRVAKGYDRTAMGPGTGKKRKRDDDAATGENVPEPPPPDNISAEEAARRAQRLVEIQIASDTQLSARKRRRRIRGLAHLPPDAPGLPPRYKSETSLDECKAYLSLNNDMYRDLRKQFEDICIEMGIIKKRLCSTGQWEAAKSRLIRESVHLSATLNPVHGDISERDNALEVICADVTKRMRIMKNRILVKDANNILGLDPEASKELRRQFYEILKADHFQTKLLCGKEHWEELKQQWLQTSTIAQQLYANGMDAEKKKCIDVLIRDAMKRHNDNNVSKISHLQSDVPFGPGPGPAKRAATKPESIRAASQSAAHRPNDLDPALFAALSSEILASNSSSVAAYFRLAPESQLEHPKMWLATLDPPSLSALRQAALVKSTNAKLVKVSGVMNEGLFQIDTDDELEAFLEGIKETPGAKVTFVVELQA